MGQKIWKNLYLLLVLFIITLAIRLYFSFQTPNFTGEEAYFHLRQIETIKETGMPLFNDELSYGGREHLFTPVFHYLIAFFSFFMPVWVAGKLISSVLICCMIFIVFSLAYEITDDEEASLFAAAVSSFIPILFRTTLNTLSPYVLVVPLTLYSFLCFMKIKEGDYLYRFLISFFILTVVHPSALLLIPIFLIYLVLIKLENLNQSRTEIEVILFSVFLVLWVNFIIYKNALLFHGISVIWRNLPPQLLDVYFSETSVLQAIYTIGSIPVLYGMYALYQYSFSKENNRKVYVLIAFVFSITLLLWAKLVLPFVGFIYLGVIMTVLFAKFYKGFFSYIKKTRFSSFKIYFFLSVILLFILTSFIPSILYAKSSMKNAVSEEEIKALDWLNENTEQGAVVVSTLAEGDLITSVAKRKNIADPHFLLINDAEERVSALTTIYKSPFETEAVSLLDQYDVSYIYFSDKARQQFGIDSLSYIKDTKCFKLVYNKNIKIYRSICELQ